MKTNKKKITKNKTRKIHTTQLHPSLKVLEIGYPLYASKSFNGEKLLEYQKNAEKEANDHCLLQNSSWFGDYSVAKSYKTPTNKTYKWVIKNKTNLVNINQKNKDFFDFIFTHNNKKLVPTIVIKQEDVKKINKYHPYLGMDTNERAYYEFKFVFGYLTLEEQYHFLKWIAYLIEKKFIEMNTRENKSILTKVYQKMVYYKTNIFFKRKQMYNRLSFYNLDKHAIMNLCKVVPKKYNINGVYQKNDTSFWFPDFVIYKMNIQEYILFNPPHNLKFVKEV